MVLSLVAMLSLVSSSCPGPVRTQLQLDLENVHDNDLGDVVIDTVRDMGHDYDVDLEDIRNDIDVNEIIDIPDIPDYDIDSSDIDTDSETDPDTPIVVRYFLDRDRDGFTPDIEDYVESTVGPSGDYVIAEFNLPRGEDEEVLIDCNDRSDVGAAFNPDQLDGPGEHEPYTPEGLVALDGLDNNCNDEVDEGYRVTIPAGTFPMGCDPLQTDCSENRDAERHEVFLSEFEIDMFEVTNRQYRECDRNGP